MPFARNELSLCRALLLDHFGSTVADVGMAILRETLALPLIIARLKPNIGPKMVKRSLVILEQHGLVSFSLDSSLRIMYTLKYEAVEAMACYPRACMIAKTLFGPAAEAVCEEIASQGKISCSDTLRRARARLELSIVELKEKFTMLAQTQFIQRCPPVESVVRGCPIFAENYERYAMPDVLGVSADDDKSDVKPSTSRKRKAEQADSDSDILWFLNISKFQRYVRDELVLDVVCASKKQERAYDLFLNSTQSLLKVAELRVPSIFVPATPPIPLMDIVRSAKDNNLPIDKKDIEWALTVIADESKGIIRKVGESGGGLYMIDFDCAVSAVVTLHVESMLREQIDGKAVRIRRLLKTRGYLEEDFIDKMVMLSAKQTRDLLYSMLEEHYICCRPIGKTSDFAPPRTIYLYHVNETKTAQSMVENICKMMHNLIVRRQHLTAENKTLVDRQVKMETILANIEADAAMDEETKKQQKEEVEGMYMGDAEKKKLEIVRNAQNKLHMSEVEVERVLFTFKLFLYYRSRKIS